ncbi:MAG: hypothetical protein K0S40_2206 [Actinomycetospora sp.]|nr:hypothetical protein [Actinomycetospora sp.]
MDEDVPLPGGGGSTLGPDVAPRPDLTTVRSHPPLPERARYRPLRGLDEILDEFLGGPSAPG